MTAAKRKERKRLAESPRTLSYWPKVHVPEGVAFAGARKVFLVGAAIIVVCAVLGFAALTAMAIFVTALLTYAVYRKPGIPRPYALLEVRDGVLEIRSGELLPKGNRALQKEATLRLSTNVSDILALTVEELPLPGAPLARVCIVEKDRTTPVTETFHPRHDPVAFSKNLRSFLRSVGWVPAKERSEDAS